MRWLFEGYLMHHDSSISGSTIHSSARSAYLQLERRISENNTVYTRGETTIGAGHDPYLLTFPLFLRSRSLIGLRHELNTKQAIKIEFGRSRAIDVQYNSVLLQWSAAYP